MRKEPCAELDRFRQKHPSMPDSPAGANYGWFRFPLSTIVLSVMSSGSHNGSEWEHVSVSSTHRCPRWEEMQLIKDIFWDEEETVIQFHPKKANYVNKHPYCLHLWKRVGVEHELPPEIFVG